jgi:hypothetical protein
VDTLPEPYPGPTLFLIGRFDHWCGYQEAYRILENYLRATFAVLDRAGHAVTHEQNFLFKALVNEWLNRVEECAFKDARELKYNSNKINPIVSSRKNIVSTTRPTRVKR